MYLIPGPSSLGTGTQSRDQLSHTPGSSFLWVLGSLKGPQLIAGRALEDGGQFSESPTLEASCLVLSLLPGEEHTW